MDVNKENSPNEYASNNEGANNITFLKARTFILVTLLGLTGAQIACDQTQQTVSEGTMEALNPTGTTVQTQDIEPTLAATAEAPITPTAPPTVDNSADSTPTPEAVNVVPEIETGNVLAIGGSELIQGYSQETVSIDVNLILENVENTQLFNDYERVKIPVTESNTVNVIRLIDNEGKVVAAFNTVAPSSMDYNPITTEEGSLPNLSPSRTVSDGETTTVIHLNPLFSAEELEVNQGGEEGVVVADVMPIEVWNTEKGYFDVRWVLVDSATGEILSVPEDTIWDSHTYELRSLHDYIDPPVVILNSSGLLEVYDHVEIPDGQTVLALNTELSYYVLGEPAESLPAIEAEQYTIGSFFFIENPYENRIVITTEAEIQRQNWQVSFDEIYSSPTNQQILAAHGITSLEVLEAKGFILPEGVEPPSGTIPTPNIIGLELDKPIDMSKIEVELIYPDIAEGVQVSSIINSHFSEELKAELKVYRAGGLNPFRWDSDNSRVICWIPIPDGDRYRMKLLIFDRHSDGISDEGNLLPTLQDLQDNPDIAKLRINRAINLAIKMWGLVGVDRFDQFEGSQYFSILADDWYTNQDPVTSLIVDHPALR